MDRLTAVTPMLPPAAGVALRGLAGAGVANAGTVISQLVRAPSTMGESETRLVTSSDAESGLLVRPPVLATHVTLDDPVVGHLLMVFDEAASRWLTERLLGGRPESSGRMISVLEQVGTIATSAFVIAAGRFCGFPLGGSIPRVESAEPGAFIRDVITSASADCPHGVLASDPSARAGQFGLVVSRYSLPLLTSGLPSDSVA